MLAYVSLILTFIIGYSAAEPTMTVSISNNTIEQGGTVLVTCRVSEYETGDLVTWYKKQGEEATVQMGTNSELNDVFKDTGRYTVFPIQNNDGVDLSFQMEITGAVAQDSGEIGCELRAKGLEEQFVSLSVLVPVKEIHLFGMDAVGNEVEEYYDGQTVEFNEYDEYYFKCEAEGSNPQPNIRLYLDEEDLTHKFQYESSYTVGAGQPGLKQVTYKATATASSPLTITKEQNARSFKCESSVHENIEPVRLEIIPSMSFKPFIECPDVLSRPAFTLNLRVECMVKADPHTEEIYLTWQSIHGEDEELRPSDPDEGHYRMEVLSTDRVDEKQVIFEVDRLFPQTFRTYTLHARNSEGEVTRNIILERDTSGDSSGSFIVTSIWTTLVMMTTALLF